MRLRPLRDRMKQAEGYDKDKNGKLFFVAQTNRLKARVGVVLGNATDD